MNKQNIADCGSLYQFTGKSSSVYLVSVIEFDQDKEFIFIVDTAHSIFSNLNQTIPLKTIYDIFR